MKQFFICVTCNLRIAGCQLSLSKYMMLCTDCENEECISKVGGVNFLEPLRKDLKSPLGTESKCSFCKEVEE